MSQTSNLAVLDLDHLSKMTMGDEGLAAEIIAIFQEQAAIWGRLLSAKEPAGTWADAAHTLKGSALGIGAIRLARYCERAETLGRSGTATPAQAAVALDDVRAALGEALEAAAAAAHKFAVSSDLSASNASNS